MLSKMVAALVLGEWENDHGAVREYETCEYGTCEYRIREYGTREYGAACEYGTCAHRTCEYTGTCEYIAARKYRTCEHEMHEFVATRQYGACEYTGACEYGCEPYLQNTFKTGHFALTTERAPSIWIIDSRASHHIYNGPWSRFRTYS